MQQLRVAPDFEIPLANDSARESSGSFSDGDDIFMTIGTRDGNDFVAIEQPRPLGRKESLQKERQISVDPISVRGPMVRQASFTLVSPLHPAAQPPGRTLTLPSPPPKLKFVSTSLPSSTSSSPRSGSSSLLKKIWKNQNDGSPRPTSSLSRQHSSMDESDPALQQSRSTSDGGASTPSDEFEFDLMLERPSTKQASMYDQPTKPDTHRDRDYQSRRGKEADMPEDGFKCGKLCLFLPRGKGKPVKASSSSVSPLPPRASVAPSHKSTNPQAISRTVSLERFECESVSNDAEREPTNLFFDLPLELIRCSVSDMQSPVTAAFLFDKDDKLEKGPKGVLKNTSGSPQDRKSKSHDSAQRHVRFSTSSPTTHPSSPTCVTPRLRKARDDFSAFLEAQST